MDTLKYVIKRLLMAILILFGVSIIIYALSRMMPTDYVDQQYSSFVTNGQMKQEDVDRIKEIYGLYMPDAYVSAKPQDGTFNGKKFTKTTKKDTYVRVEDGVTSYLDFYAGSFDCGKRRIELKSKDVNNDDGTFSHTEPDGYIIYEVIQKGVTVTGDDGNADNSTIQIVEEETPVEAGSFVVYEEDDGTHKKGDVVFTRAGVYVVDEEGNRKFVADTTTVTYSVVMSYRPANFWDKTGAVLGGYFTWLGNLLKGDLGMSFKYKQPVGTVIVENMGISFIIAFIATILQFLIAIPLGIKAATNQYGVVDYTVTVLTMIGISLPTFFLGALVLRVFSLQLGWFPLQGLTGSLPEGASWIVVLGDQLWHMVLPMFVLVILSVGSLMRYTRTNTLEVLNADYIRTARAKGLSEHTVIYKHAFRNTMIPIVTLLAGTIPSLFGGAMITETVFAIPGIGKLAYDALVAADVPFIMGYNMFIAIMTVLGTLISDLLYAVVDPRVKLTK